MRGTKCLIGWEALSVTVTHMHANSTRTSLLRENDKGGELPIGGALRRWGA